MWGIFLFRSKQVLGWHMVWLLVLFYIFIQGTMYVTSFASINTKLKLWDAIILFLKRNFISVFLPAGAVSSLVFFSNEIEKKGITRTQVYFASSHLCLCRNSLSGYSVANTGFPVCCIWRRHRYEVNGTALAAVIAILLLFVFVYYSLLKKGKLYYWILKIYPKAELFIWGHEKQ